MTSELAHDMTQATYLEKRRLARLRPKDAMEVTIRRGGLLGLVLPPSKAKLIDISPVGAGVRISSGNWRMKQWITLSMMMGTELAPVKGQIIWQTPTTDGWKLGISFAPNNPDIERFLRLHKHQFF